VIYLLLIIGILPPADIKAVDKPNDAGSKINLSWTLSHDDATLDGYVVLRRTIPDTVYDKIGSTMHGVTFFEDENTDDGEEYTYIVAAVKNSELFYSEPSSIVRSYPQVFMPEELMY